MPEDQKCYAAYTQGNCKYDEILTVTEVSGTPKCVKNECPNGEVFFKNSCYPLNEEKACGKYQNLIGRKVYLVVNPTTLQLNCLDIDEKFVCSGGCCIGSHQLFLGNCGEEKQRANELIRA